MREHDKEMRVRGYVMLMNTEGKGAGVSLGSIPEGLWSGVRLG